MRCGQRDFFDFGASGAELVDSLFDLLLHLGVETFAEIFGGDADAQTLDRLFNVGGEIGDGALRAGGVHGVVAGDDVEERCGVADIGGEGADAVER